MQGQKGPLNIGTRKQLFTDEELIAERKDVELVLNPGRKHPENPLLRVEKPWEGWKCYLYGSVLYDEDEGVFKMWYIAGGPPHLTCYATSPDGIRWSRPALNLPEWRKYGEGNNILGLFHLAGVFKDKEAPAPEKRWKMICWDPTPIPGARPDEEGRPPIYGYATKVSPDGIRWKPYSKGPIAPGSDVITGVYDEVEGIYIAIPKVRWRIGEFTRRSFAITTSRDFEEWTEARFCLGADETDDAGMRERIEAVRPILQAPDDPDLMRTEFYGVGMMPYESTYLAFIWVFTINNKSLWSSNQDGPIELQLASSRDLYHWHRCGGRRQIIEQGEVRGRDDADWDSGMITTANSPLIVGDEIWLYYGGHNFTHGDRVLYHDDPRRGRQATAAIGLATWRLDGFMSADVGPKPGMLTTKPLVFGGDHLVLNADAKGGEVVVEILDESGHPLVGFDRVSCDEFRGDDLRHTVTWKGRSDLSELAGRTISLRFHMRNAKVYSYAFRSSRLSEM